MSADIENLLAEGRDAADGKKEQLVAPKIEKPSITPAPIVPVASQTIKPGTTGGNDQTLIPTVSSSDEEGEIRGDISQPPLTDQPLQSVESRQDTTTEAQEKLDRQMETKTVYGALKQGKSRPTNISTSKTKTKTAASKDLGVSPKTAENSKAQAAPPKVTRDHQPAQRARNGAYDSYKPDRDNWREPDRETGELYLSLEHGDLL